MNFFKEFEKSNWNPIVYDNKTIRISDSLNVISNNQVFTIILESTNSDWEQGIILQSKKAHFYFDEFERINGAHFWEDEIKGTISFTVTAPQKSFKIWNIWRVDNGPIQYGHNGAALYFEEIENGKRYYCNDGYPDDDFDDLVFQLMWK